MNDVTSSEEIDKIIKEYGGWKGDAIKRLRAVIKDAAPGIVEEIKWKMPTRPEGLPVWVYGGIICYVETWKDNIKLIFSKGAQMTDPNKLFNARLQSSMIRAIELHEGDTIDKTGIRALVIEAVELNTGK